MFLGSFIVFCRKDFLTNIYLLLEKLSNVCYNEATIIQPKGEQTRQQSAKTTVAEVFSRGASSPCEDIWFNKKQHKRIKMSGYNVRGSLCAVLLNKFYLRRDCLMMKNCNLFVHPFTNRRFPLLFRMRGE